MEINGKVYQATRLKLKKWLELEAIQVEVSKAVENTENASDKIISYISTAFDIPNSELITLSWIEITLCYKDVLEANLVNRDIPLFKYTEKRDDEESWEYEGRTWYTWAHTFAKEFGWSLEYVAELDVDDALRLMQEIVLHEQLDKEFLWMLSENSIHYDETTKKSRFEPLPRPSWMRKEIRQPKIVKIPKSLIPEGKIISYKDYAKSS